MGNISRSDPAKHDLIDIWDFIAQDNYDAADRFIDKIETVFRSLCDSPMMGRSRSQDLLVPNLRSFPIGNYIIFYFPTGEDSGVTIARVLHAARDVEDWP